MKAKLVKDALSENDYPRKGEYTMSRPQYEAENDCNCEECDCEECECE